MCLPDDVLAGGLRESGTTVFLLAESVARGRLDDFSWSEITLLTLHFVSIAKYNGLNDNTVSDDGDCDQHQGPSQLFWGRFFQRRRKSYSSGGCDRAATCRWNNERTYKRRADTIGLRRAWLLAGQRNSGSSSSAVWDLLSLWASEARAQVYRIAWPWAWQ